MSARPFLEPGQQPPAKPPKFPSKPAPGRPPRRRGLLGAMAALAAAPTVAAALPSAAHPDAALLAACAHHAAASEEERRVVVLYREAPEEGLGYDAAEAAWNAAWANASEALDAVTALPATTLEGVAAKGRAVMTYIRALEGPDEILNSDEMAARSVLLDLERLAGRAA